MAYSFMDQNPTMSGCEYNRHLAGWGLDRIEKHDSPIDGLFCHIRYSCVSVSCHIPSAAKIPP